MDPREKLLKLLHTSLQTENPQLTDELVRRSDFVQAGKGARLYREGEQIEECYFLLSGVVRMYYKNPEGEEVTEWIYYEPGTIIHPSFKLCDCNTAKASCEVLTDSELAHIPLASLLEVMRLYPEFEQLRVGVLQRTLARQTVLRRTMSHKSPSERYAWFVENWTELVETIPQKYIASFLGMTPVSLSRIRSRYKGKPAEE